LLSQEVTLAQGWPGHDGQASARLLLVVWLLAVPGRRADGSGTVVGATVGERITLGSKQHRKQK
jgi:hypothetical protein